MLQIIHPDKTYFMKPALSLLFTLMLYSAMSQNTGINITTPQSKLHIFRGSSGYPGPYPHQDLIIEGSDHTWINFLAPNNKEMGVLFGKPSHVASGGIIYDINNNMHFRTNGNVNRLNIDENGNIGIGTIDPQARLEIYHASGFSSPTLKLSDLNTGGLARIHFHNEGTGIKFWEIAAYTDDAVQPNSYMTFSHLNQADVLNLKGDGRIGIGTFVPQARLDIRHISETGNPHLLLYDLGIAGSPTIQFQNASGSEMWQIVAFVNSGNVSQSELLVQNSMGQHLNIRGNGFVGVGKVPTERLDVNGTVKANSIIASNFNNILATNINATSVTSGNYSLSPAKTYYHTIGSGDFIARNSSELLYTETLNGGSIYLLNGNEGLVAPVHLPPNAVMTAMSVTLRDNSPTVDFSITLREAHIIPANANVVTAGVPGETTLLDNTISDPSYSSSTAYVIMVTTVGGNWPGADMLIRKVVITYTLNSL